MQLRGSHLTGPASNTNGVELQHPTYLVDTVIVETTVLEEQKTLTTQFYLLLAESSLYVTDKNLEILRHSICIIGNLAKPMFPSL